MKKIITLLAIFLLTSCSSDDTEETPTNIQNLNVAFTVGNTDLVIDEKLTIRLQANKSMDHIQVFKDGVMVFNQLSASYHADESFYFDYDIVGDKTIKFLVWNNENDAQVIAKTVNVSVTRGNAVKINKVQIVSFTNINGTWDAEFGDTDINRLADVFFVFEKPIVGIRSGGRNFNNWFTSSIKENQGDLTWDLSSENLYLNPNRRLRLGLADKDTGSFNQDLIGLPSREFSFAEYIDSQPSTITVSYPSINFEMKIDVAW